MLNLTLCALSVSHFSRSPFLAVRDSATLKHNTFSRHIAPVLFSTHFSKLNVDFCRFEKVLGGAVRLLSASDFESQTYTKQQVVSDTTGTTTFTSCLFNECSADEDGGGIKFGSWSSRATLRLSKCGFYRCKSSSKGGGVFCEGQNLEMRRTCFDKCSAKNAAAGHTTLSSSCDVSESYVSNIDSQTSGSVLLIDCDKTRVSHMNITNIDVRDGTGALGLQGSEVICTDVYFGKCDLANVLKIDESNEAVKRVNFVETRGREVLLKMSQTSMTFEDCAFVRDKSTKIIDKYAKFRSCLFSDPFDPGQFERNVYTPDCKFGAGWQTKPIDMQASDVCWERMPTPEPTKPPEPTQDQPTPPPPTEAPSRQGLTVGIVVAVICVLAAMGLVAFFLFRWCRGTAPDQRLLLMYAQV